MGSAVNMRKRGNSHQRLLDTNKHHARVLQAAWEKYKPALRFEVLEVVAERESLVIREQYWIDALSPRYNSTKSAIGTGRVVSDSARRKMSESHRGYKMPKEQREKIGNANRGVPKPPGFGAKVSATRLRRGIGVSQEARAKISATLKRRASLPGWRNPSHFVTNEHRRLAWETRRNRVAEVSGGTFTAI